jgi:purine catabolism regulator
MYPTLSEVLDLPVLRAAAPRVRAGSTELGVPVRWVHVSEQRNPAGTLMGGELILSIGVHLADPASDLPGYVTALRDAQAVGLVIELGQHLRSLPDPLVQAARRLGFPLVELRRSVRFVEVTEVVHATILNSQFARMRLTQRVHEIFRTLAVEGGGAARVLAEAASLTELPVVLEDLGRRALAFAAGDVPTATLLTDWTARSRQVPVTPSTATGGPEGWTTTPVGPRAQRWGRLVVPRRVVGADAAETVALVLEHAADALTIARLLGDDPIGPELEAQGELLQDLLRSTTLDEQAMRARARALGLPAGGVLTVVVIGCGKDADTDGEGDGDSLQALAVAARAAGVPAIVGRVSAGRAGAVLSCRFRDGEAATVERVAAVLPSTAAVVGTAGPVTTFSDLAAAVTEAAFVVDVAEAMQSASSSRSMSRSPGPRRVWRSTDLGARGLLWQLRTDPRLLSFVDAQLAPLLRLDGPERTMMLETLLAYLDAGGAVTRFARAVQLSRPAAYARLDKLRNLLRCDLEQPRTRLSLHLALLALDLNADPASPTTPHRPSRVRTGGRK